MCYTDLLDQFDVVFTVEEVALVDDDDVRTLHLLQQQLRHLTLARPSI